MVSHSRVGCFCQTYRVREETSVDLQPPQTPQTTHTNHHPPPPVLLEEKTLSLSVTDECCGYLLHCGSESLKHQSLKKGHQAKLSSPNRILQPMSLGAELTPQYSGGEGRRCRIANNVF